MYTGYLSGASENLPTRHCESTVISSNHELL